MTLFKRGEIPGKTLGMIPGKIALAAREQKITLGEKSLLENAPLRPSPASGLLRRPSLQLERHRTGRPHGVSGGLKYRGTRGALQLTANIRHGCSLAWIIGRDGPYPGRAVFVTHERIVSIDLAGKSRPALG
jgi:hypothetical protein